MKKLFNYPMIAMLCIALFGATNTYAQEWSKTEKAIWQTVEKGWSDWKSGNSNDLFDGFHENYLGWNADDPMPRSKAKWKKQYEMYKEHMTIDFYDLDPTRIVVEDDCAVVYYYYKFGFTWEKDGKKNEMKFSGRNAEFYIKDGGKWQLLGDFSHRDDDKD